ncbi:aminoglycoside phosphotransferase family protein [Myceligenerans halotolerans]
MTGPASDEALAEYQHLLAEACEHVGLDPTGAKFLKLTSNAVFSLASTPYVVRIAASATIGAQAAKAVEFARWLDKRDVPTIVPVEEIPQPFEIDGHAVTVWHLVEDTGRLPPLEDLADALHRLHTSTEPPPDLPEFDQIAEIRPRLDHPALPDDLRSYLASELDDLEEEMTRAKFALPVGPIHGDPHIGALIDTPDGPVLCDYDTAAVGAREWDLIPTAVNAARFTQMDGDQDRLAAAYGWDIRDWPHYETIRRIRELRVTTAVIPIIEIDPGVRDEFHLRVRTIRERDDRQIWTPWPQVDLAAKAKQRQNARGRGQ